MQPTLQIRLFGDFQLLHHGEVVTAVHQARHQSLLAYRLLHYDAPLSRRHLAFRLWPDSTEAQALTNLRRELHHLRNAVPEAASFLIIETQTVQWRRDEALCSLDTADFERTLARADDAQQAGNVAKLGKTLMQAVDLYTGDLLPSCYDEWILSDRERLRQQYTGALERLVELFEEQAQYRAAIQMGERLLRHDPVHEVTYQRLMRLHMLSGDRAHALRVYHLCVAALQRELDIEPSPETHALYEHLLEVELAPLATAKAVQTTVVERVPLVARQVEWHTLQRAWQTARRDKIHFVLIAGEAGIGKTRLAEELLIWAGHHAIPVARTRSYAAEGRLAYAPVAEWLHSDAIQGVRLPMADTWLCEVARLLPEVLEERPELPQPGPLSESWQRLRFFEGLARAVLLGSQPLMLLIDDLQWCDQDTLEWLRYLMRFAQGNAAQPQSREHLLIVGTARSEEVGAQHPLKTLVLELRNSEQLTEIELGPLSQTATTELAHALAGDSLNSEQIAQLYLDTEGNPLFVVETLRSSGDGILSPQQERPSLDDLVDKDTYTRLGKQDESVLPPKIYAVIQSRLAQLSPPTRELAALAATIGRAFTFDVLANASDADENTLVYGLDELWQRRILREQGTSGYDFSHDRIRDVAYTEASPARRRQLHRRVAQALEEIHHANLDNVSSHIAGHYAKAGLLHLAVNFYERAALMAQQIYAHADAVASLNKALALLPQLPKTPDQQRQELKLQLDLGKSLGTLEGFLIAAVRDIYERAHELAEQVGHDEQRLMVLSGLFTCYIWRGQSQPALRIAEQGITIAAQLSDPTWLAEAYGRLGTVLYQLGQWQACRQHFERTLAITDLKRHPRARFEAAGQSSALLHRRFLANTLWYLGYPDQAVAQVRLVLEQAKELAHPYTLASALTGAAGFYSLRREVTETRALAETAIEFSQRYGFSNVIANARLYVGWALVQQGQIEAGIAQIREATANRVAIGHIRNQQGRLAALADAYGCAGQPEQGLRVLDEALQQAEATGEHVVETELHRLKGDLLQMKGEEIKIVEAHYLQALAVARQQEAKSLELRAAISLCRHWQEQGRTLEARELLSGIYAWFTEGFDTPDLQDAQSLLAELSQS